MNKFDPVNFEHLTTEEKELIKFARITKNIRPEVLEFAAAMEDKLRENDFDKGDSWKDCDIQYLKDGLFSELIEYDTSNLVSELTKANHREAEKGSPDACPDAPAAELVDIANFCMFLYHRTKKHNTE